MQRGCRSSIMAKLVANNAWHRLPVRQFAATPPSCKSKKRVPQHGHYLATKSLFGPIIVSKSQSDGYRSNVSDRIKLKDVTLSEDSSDFWNKKIRQRIISDKETDGDGVHKLDADGESQNANSASIDDSVENPKMCNCHDSRRNYDPLQNGDIHNLACEDSDGMTFKGELIMENGNFMIWTNDRVHSVLGGKTADSEEDSTTSILKFPLDCSNNKVKIPSVSRILRETMPEDMRARLKSWEDRMILKLGDQGFQEMRESTLTRGKSVHALLEAWLESGQPPDVSLVSDSVTRSHLKSIEDFMKRISSVQVIESAVCHPHLGYCGIVDCVAVMDGRLLLIDWKTSDKVKPSLASMYESPLQLAAYIGAINTDERYSRLGPVLGGGLVVIYNSGFPAHIHFLDGDNLQRYWTQWLDRLQLYRSLSD